MHKKIHSKDEILNNKFKFWEAFSDIVINENKEYESLACEYYKNKLTSELKTHFEQIKKEGIKYIYNCYKTDNRKLTFTKSGKDFFKSYNLKS